MNFLSFTISTFSTSDKKVLKIMFFLELKIALCKNFFGFSVTSKVSEIIEMSVFLNLVFSIFVIFYFFFNSGNLVKPKLIKFLSISYPK